MGILRSVFGPSKDEIWAQIAADIGGELVDGGFWGKDVLIYRHGEWQILLDTYTVSTGKTQRLKSLFDLFSVALMRLVEIDSAYQSDPCVNLK